MSPICDCGSEIDSREHFLFTLSIFAVGRNHLFKSLLNIKPSILNVGKNKLTNVLLFGSDKYEKVINVGILKSTITYLKWLRRVERPLTDQWLYPFLLRNSEKSVIKIYFYYYYYYYYYFYILKCLHFHWLFESSLLLTKFHEKVEYNICAVCSILLLAEYLERMFVTELYMFHVHVISLFYFSLFSLLSYFS